MEQSSVENKMTSLHDLSFVILAIISPVISTDILGPANFKFKAVEECPDAPKGIRVDMSGRRIDRQNFGLTMEVETPYDFDEKLGLILAACFHMDGGCKESFHFENNNACKSLENFMGDAFRDLQEKANIEGCPFPKGTYKVENWIFDNSKFEVPQVYGSYTAEYKLTYKGENQSCVRLHYDLEPKKKWA